MPQVPLLTLTSIPTWYEESTLKINEHTCFLVLMKGAPPPPFRGAQHANTQHIFAQHMSEPQLVRSCSLTFLHVNVGFQFTWYYCIIWIYIHFLLSIICCHVITNKIKFSYIDTPSVLLLDSTNLVMSPKFKSSQLLFLSSGVDAFII